MPLFEDRAARTLGLSFYGDTQVRVRNCISNSKYVPKSGFHPAKLPVDVGLGYFRGRDLRRRSGLPLHTRPCRFTTPLRVACIEDECGRAGIGRPMGSVSPFTAIRMYGSVNAFGATTFYEIASPSRRDRRRCSRRLLSKTRSFEGVLSSAAKRFATMPLRTCHRRAFLTICSRFLRAPPIAHPRLLFRHSRLLFRSKTATINVCLPTQVQRKIMLFFFSFLVRLAGEAHSTRKGTMRKKEALKEEKGDVVGERGGVPGKVRGDACEVRDD